MFFFPTICISTQAWTHDSGKCSCDQLSFTKHVRYCSAWTIMRQGINTFLPVRQHSACVSLWHVSLLCFVLFCCFFSLRLLFTHLRAWNEDFCDADISKKLRVPSHGSYHKPFLWSVKSQMLREGPVIYWLMSWKFKIPSINFNFFMNLLILFKLFFHRFGVEVIMNWLVK